MVLVKSKCNDSRCNSGMRAAKILKQIKTSKNITVSGLVTSAQTSVHPHLKKYLRQHLDKPWLQPFHRPTLEAYQRLTNTSAVSLDKPFILDSGCGTGKSTQALARRFPRRLVVGVDRSRARLAKSGLRSFLLCEQNCILVRAELSTFWRLLANDGYSPEIHYLLYPNPWPKPGHLLRRWHGHPVFPQLLSLGGQIELRCNWEIYAQEFAQAVGYATGTVVDSRGIKPDCGISPFEQKYLERGQSLYSVTVPAAVTQAFRRARKPG